MKMFLVACVLALAALSAADVLDDFDYIGLFKNEQKWKASRPCLLEKAPCGELQELKDATVQRLRSKCGQCTPKQLEKYNRELEALRTTYPDDYEAVKNKYLS